MNNCKWLSDEFTFFCCNNLSFCVADWCAFDGIQELCKYYEPANVKTCPKCGGMLSEVRDNGMRHCYSCHFEFEETS